MSKTGPSYRRAAAREIRKWKIFREQLDKSERNHLMNDGLSLYIQLCWSNGLQNSANSINTYVHNF